MTKKLEHYTLLLSQFIHSEITAYQFETSYIKMFKNESGEISDEIYNTLNDLFSDVDAYCDNLNLRDDNDLDEAELMGSAKKALKKLINNR